MANYQWIAPTAMAVGLLVGCGGGGGSDVPMAQTVPGTEVPVGVEVRVDDVIAFSKAQQANTDDTRDPVVVGNATLATSDTDEPAEI